MNGNSPHSPLFENSHFANSNPTCYKCRNHIPIEQIYSFDPCFCSVYHAECVRELENTEKHDPHIVHLNSPAVLRCFQCRKRVDKIAYGYQVEQSLFVQNRTPSVGQQTPISPDPNYFRPIPSMVNLPQSNYGNSSSNHTSILPQATTHEEFSNNFHPVRSHNGERKPHHLKSTYNDFGVKKSILEYPSYVGPNEIDVHQYSSLSHHPQLEAMNYGQNSVLQDLPSEPSIHQSSQRSFMPRSDHVGNGIPRLSSDRPSIKRNSSSAFTQNTSKGTNHTGVGSSTKSTTPGDVSIYVRETPNDRPSSRKGSYTNRQRSIQEADINPVRVHFKENRNKVHHPAVQHHPDSNAPERGKKDRDRNGVQVHIYVNGRDGSAHRRFFRFRTRSRSNRERFRHIRDCFCFHHE